MLSHFSTKSKCIFLSLPGWPPLLKCSVSMERTCPHFGTFIPVSVNLDIQCSDWCRTARGLGPSMACSRRGTSEWTETRERQTATDVVGLILSLRSKESFRVHSPDVNALFAACSIVRRKMQYHNLYKSTSVCTATTRLIFIKKTHDEDLSRRPFWVRGPWCDFPSFRYGVFPPIPQT